MKETNRETFTSQLGIVLSATGSAVGLGNIWRFSYITGVNGGGAFLLIYLVCVFLVGLPILIAELTVGRYTQKSPVTAYKEIAPKSFWMLGGLLGVAGAFCIMTYYPLITGWSLGYVFESLFHWQDVSADTEAAFASYSSSLKPLAMQAAVLLITAAALTGGVAKGIERWSKVLMPLLLVILIVLIVRSLTLPGAGEGVRFLFYPDLSKLGLHSILDALGHSFYSLSVGMGIMITYGSYISKKADLVRTSTSVLLLDTCTALLAGLAIFPAVFALGVDPAEGVGLAFVTLPRAFATLPMGRIFAALFFLLLTISAITSMMSLVQVLLAFAEDEFGLSRRRGLLLFCALLLLLGIPSTLSFGPLSDFTILGMTYFDFMDRLATNVLVPLSGLMGALLVTIRFGSARSQKELVEGAKNPRALVARIYPFAIKWLAPTAIIVILLNALGLFRLLA